VTTKGQRSRLFETARAVAAVLTERPRELASLVLAGDFYGSVEIQIQNGKVHLVKVVETLKESDKGNNP